jgi:hypothetical protein
VDDSEWPVAIVAPFIELPQQAVGFGEDGHPQLVVAVRALDPAEVHDRVDGPVRQLACGWDEPSRWIEAGLTALARGGPDAVRVEALAAELGVAKGGVLRLLRR